MFLSLVISSLYVSLIKTSDISAGYAQEYLNTNYTPLISQTYSISNKSVVSKLSCLYECLRENDCSLTVFNQINHLCMMYNTYPVINQEFLVDNNMIVYVLQRTIQLPTLISNTNWLISRLNKTIPTKSVSVQYPRCLVLDRFGYLLSLEAKNNTVYINRYDRIGLILIRSEPLSMPYTSLGMLSYSNGMIFVSGSSNISFVFDDINFGLLGTVSCGGLLQPRDVIVIESQNLLIIASQTKYRLVFVHFDSPTNYSCLNTTLLLGNDPQGLYKINEIFFYVTYYNNNTIDSFYFDGQTWIQSLFVNVKQSLGVTGIYTTHLHVDSLQRRWVMVINFGIVIYDEWGNLLSFWKYGSKPFDIYISDDYRFIVSDNANFLLNLYEPLINI